MDFLLPPLNLIDDQMILNIACQKGNTTCNTVAGCCCPGWPQVKEQ